MTIMWSGMHENHCIILKNPTGDHFEWKQCRPYNYYNELPTTTIGLMLLFLARLGLTHILTRVNWHRV